MAIEVEIFPAIVKLEHLKAEVPEDHLCDQRLVNFELCVVTAEQDETERGNRDLNLLLVDHGMIAVLLLRFLLEAEEFLTVRVIPDA